MSVTIITPEDLQLFRSELLREIKELFVGTLGSSGKKKWLKSHEVRSMLGISAGTLQNLRDSNMIAFSKVNGLILYDYDDIIISMEAVKTLAKSQQSLIK